MRKLVAVFAMIGMARAAGPAGWSEPVEVRHQETLALTYRARLDGPYLVIRAAIEPGWHTFAMDNKVRAEEKLAGKKALSVDQPTEFTLTGIRTAGGWLQSSPKDFSRPELRMFSWGYEKEAVFAVRARRVGAGPMTIGVRGQACTETICKNIDATIAVPPPTGRAAETDVKSLIPVK
jgi:hypothetical protein